MTARVHKELSIVHEACGSDDVCSSAFFVKMICQSRRNDDQLHPISFSFEPQWTPSG